MAIRLHPGVYTSAIALGGAGAVTLDLTRLWVGWSLIAAAVLLLIWGLKINERHWWAYLLKGRGEVAPNDKAVREALARLHREYDTFTLWQAGCLLAGVLPTRPAFDQSDLAQSKATALRYYVQRGSIPIAGAPGMDQSRRRAARNMMIETPPVTWDTYITKAGFDRYANKHTRLWLKVMDQAEPK